MEKPSRRPEVSRPVFMAEIKNIADKQSSIEVPGFGKTFIGISAELALVVDRDEPFLQHNYLPGAKVRMLKKDAEGYSWVDALVRETPEQAQARAQAELGRMKAQLALGGIALTNFAIESVEPQTTSLHNGTLLIGPEGGKLIVARGAQNELPDNWQDLIDDDLTVSRYPTVITFGPSPLITPNEAGHAAFLGETGYDEPTVPVGAGSLTVSTQSSKNPILVSHNSLPHIV